jgi:hypothetical protein
MRRSINYSIKTFQEFGSTSTSMINNIISTSKASSWKTRSDHAVLEINFEPTESFEVTLGET